MCICRNTYFIYIDISRQKTKNICTKIYILLEQLKINNMQRTSVFFAVLSKSGFHLHHCQNQPQSFLFKQPVSLEEWWRILLLMYTLLHLKMCFIRVKSAGHSTISNNAGRAQYHAVHIDTKHCFLNLFYNQ